MGVSGLGTTFAGSRPVRLMAELKFGVATAGRYPLGMPPVEDIIEMGERVEGLGFDSVWVGDHITTHLPKIECLTLLSIFAARTSHITLGTGVLLLPLRHPTVVAKMVSTLDYLSGGRVILGVGVGGEFSKEWEACGVALKERGRRANEGIEILKELWSQSGVSYQGRYYRFEGVMLDPKPAQKGGPPVWIGGRSEAALKRAAMLGDGWIGYMQTPERYRQSLEKIREYAEESGRDLSASFTPAHTIFTRVAATREEARQTAIEALSRQYNQPFDNLVDRYCAVGRPEDCAERMGAFIEAGVTHLIIHPIAGAEDEIEQTRACADEIVPRLRTAY